jgi:hypothetical protein
VVFIGDTAGYIPVPNLRTRDLPSAPDDVDWHHPVESWDREYRRFRFNTTRVQREFRYLIPIPKVFPALSFAQAVPVSLAGK